MTFPFVVNASDVLVMGVDPGITSGVSLHKVESGGLTLLDMHEVAYDGLQMYLDGIYDFAKIAVLVIEDFITDFERLGNGRFHTTETSQIIGMFHRWAWERYIPLVVMQQSSIKPMGYGYAGLKYVKGRKGTHMQDSIAHAWYFFETLWPRMEHAIRNSMEDRHEEGAPRKALNIVRPGDANKQLGRPVRRR